MKKPPTTVYSGRRIDPAQRTASAVEVCVDGRELNPYPSQRIFDHSPNGFNWGYGGSGPSQLALGILLDYYGEGSPELRMYQAFKFRVIAALPQEDDWTLTGQQIEDALREIADERERAS